jgi:hypothetical protein
MAVRRRQVDDDSSRLFGGGLVLAATHLLCSSTGANILAEATLRFVRVSSLDLYIVHAAASFCFSTALMTGITSINTAALSFSPVMRCAS